MDTHRIKNEIVTEVAIAYNKDNSVNQDLIVQDCLERIAKELFHAGYKSIRRIMEEAALNIRSDDDNE